MKSSPASLAIIENSIGGRELDVSPGVREQLGQLGLFGVGAVHLDTECTEEPAGRSEDIVIADPDDLGQFEEFLHGEAFGDSLRAEGDVHLKSGSGKRFLHGGGHSGKDRRPQHKQLFRPQIGAEVLHRLNDSFRLRVQVFVDRGSDDDDHVSGPTDAARSVVARKSPLLNTRASTSPAPSSMKGICPPFTVSTALWLMSYDTTLSPESASANASGRPTWPHPPTTATFMSTTLSTTCCIRFIPFSTGLARDDEELLAKDSPRRRHSHVGIDGPLGWRGLHASRGVGQEPRDHECGFEVGQRQGLHETDVGERKGVIQVVPELVLPRYLTLGARVIS